MKRPFIVAHRGFRGLYPESTIPCFEAALQLPVDAIEFDLHPTKDGEIVVSHDDSVERCSNGTGLIREKTFAELRALDFGAWKDPKFAGEKIPTFQELLDCVQRIRPDIFLCCELKEDDTYCAQRALDMLKAAGRLHNCSIISFHPAMLEFANAYESDLQIHGFLQFPGERGSHVPVEKLDDYYTILRRAGMPYAKATVENVKFLHDRGINVDVWEPNTPEELQHCMEVGVDYITTARPDIICHADNRC